jgi:prophage regulatory protein
MDITQNNAPLRLLAPKAAAERTSLSWRSVQRKVRDGTFPAPVKLSDHRIAFIEAEVNAWIASLSRTTEAA